MSGSSLRPSRNPQDKPPILLVRPTPSAEPTKGRSAYADPVRPEPDLQRLTTRSTDKTLLLGGPMDRPTIKSGWFDGHPA